MILAYVLMVKKQPNGNVKITIPLDEQMKKYTDLKVVYISDAGEITGLNLK